MNERLRHERLSRGWSLKRAAERLNQLDPTLRATPNYFIRWETKGVVPHPHHIALLCRLYDRPSPADLGFDGEPPGPAGGPPAPVPPALALLPGPGAGLPLPHVFDHGHRRDFLRSQAALAGLGAGSPLSPDHWDRLLRLLTAPASLDEPALAALEARTRALHELERTIPAPQLFSHVANHLDRMTELLAGSMNAAWRRRLVVSVGETAVLAAWVAWDRGDSASATRLYDVATSASQEAKDPAILACALGYMSYALSSIGDHAQSAALLSRAVTQVSAETAPATYAWLQARLAEELSHLDDSQALRAMDRSTDTFGRARPSDERPWTGFLSRARLDSFAISVHLRVGRPADARAIASRLFASVVSTKVRAIALADIAAINLEAGDVDEAIDLAQSALAAALELRSTWALAKLRTLSRSLATTAAIDPRLTRFADQLAAVTG